MKKKLSIFILACLTIQACGIKESSVEETQILQQADIMWINNEFTYSDRGQPLPGKAYTFRANPDRVENLKLLGVDIVGLANNHVYDYGKEALLDTMDTLSFIKKC